ncbi:YcxB family protein [Neorhizobium sp. CSC1952]|uniref:YcxB family protein n=1 Tax=Neorhizobium sp. CSC1952 TaxID=2978974 RepID=UPI0025A50C5B|nr:YcxB family protein [Rhizobium sp. CSC1952]WJR67865.1 YcxB family protein [Rhizobium sp. CSC1952]
MELQGSHHFPVRFDDEVVSDAVRAFVVQRTVREQKMKWRAAALMVVASLFLVVQGNFTLAVLAIVVACFPAIFSAIVWRVHSANTFGRYNRMADRRADITIDPEGFGISSDLGSGNLTWRNVTEIWERPRSFMLFSGANAFNILPRDTMPEEVQAFLSARSVRR